VKKFLIALIGGTVLLLGVVMLVLPGPGALVIAAGVAILATEFVWARRVWRKAKGHGGPRTAQDRPARLAAPDQGALEQEESLCGTWWRAACPLDFAPSKLTNHDECDSQIPFAPPAFPL